MRVTVKTCRYLHENVQQTADFDSITVITSVLLLVDRRQTCNCTSTVSNLLYQRFASSAVRLLSAIVEINLCQCVTILLRAMSLGQDDQHRNLLHLSIYYLRVTFRPSFEAPQCVSASVFHDIIFATGRRSRFTRNKLTFGHFAALPPWCQTNSPLSRPSFSFHPTEEVFRAQGHFPGWEWAGSERVPPVPLPQQQLYKLEESSLLRTSAEPLGGFVPAHQLIRTTNLSDSHTCKAQAHSRHHSCLLLKSVKI